MVIDRLLQELKNKYIKKDDFDVPDVLQKSGKYNFMIPKDLLNKQFKEDCIDIDGMKENVWLCIIGLEL